LTSLPRQCTLAEHMPQERTAQQIYSEILLVQTSCSPPPNKEQIVQGLLQEYKMVCRVELTRALDTIPFILSCSECDIDSPDSYEQALAAGWQGIVGDDGPGWFFLGICRECSERSEKAV